MERTGSESSPAMEKSKTVTTARSKSAIENNPYFSTLDKQHRGRPDLLNHFNARDLKELFKCSVSAWVTVLLILIYPSLVVLGQAAFFGTMVQFMIPPSGVFITQLMGGATLILGICLAWAWGVITMKAALAARPAADLNAQYAALAQLGSPNSTYVQQATGQTTWQQIAIYDGAMLDTRVTVVYFCMMGLYIYLMARLRVANPKMTLLSMFGMIVSDIFISTAPLLPTFQGTIPRTFVIPAAASLGIGLTCNLLFFPRSVSSVVRDNTVAMLEPIDDFLSALVLHLEDSTQRFRLEHLLKVKGTVIAAYKTQEASEQLLAMDISYGKWGPDDTKSLHKPVRRVLASFMSLLQIILNREQSRLRHETLEKQDQLIHSDTTEKTSHAHVGVHQITKTLDFRRRMWSADVPQQIHRGLAAIYSSSDELVGVCIDALAAIQETLKHGSGSSFLARPSATALDGERQRHADILARLKQQLEKYMEISARDLLQENDVLVGDGHVGSGRISGLIYGIMMVDRLSHFAEAVSELLARLVDLEIHGKKDRLWLPNSGLQKIGAWALDNDSPAPGALARTITSVQDDDSTKSRRRMRRKKKEQQKSDKEKNKKSRAESLLLNMHETGGYQRGKAAQAFLGFYHTMTNSGGLFALRVVVATLALAIPGVVRSSAGFFYREKGLWVLIMAQTGLVEFSGDFVFGFVLRVIGTVFGGILGMVVWYIGAGNGPGNPYGMAAIMAVAIVIFMYLRLFAPPAFLQGVILMAATLLLVMAYSWCDTHIPSYGNPGVGYAVFWRRTLLVLIGLGVGAVVTFVPRPPSANRHYRKIMARTLQDLQNRYVLFATVCGDSSAETWDDLREVTEKHAIDTIEVLLGITGPIKATKFEFSSSPFNESSLSRICALCVDLNACITRLLMYAADPEYRPSFVRASNAIEESFFANVMAVMSLLQETLVTGRPLPAILPVPLLTSTTWASQKHGVEGEDWMLSITKDTITDTGFRKYCQALSSFAQMTGCIDELVMVVKQAVGESGISPGLVLNHRFKDVEAQDMDKRN